MLLEEHQNVLRRLSRQFDETGMETTTTYNIKGKSLTKEWKVVSVSEFLNIFTNTTSDREVPT